jgi:hypothetical protein
VKSRTDTNTSGRSRRSRYWLAATVAAVGVLVAIVWGGVVTAGALDTIDDLPRSEIPGNLTLDIDQPDVQTVSYERRTFTATTPLDRDIDLEVSGPDAEPVTVEPYDTPVTYRAWRLVGQAHATFEADVAGQYTVTVDGDAPDDASIAVAADPPTRLVSGFIGPAVLLLVAFGVAAAIALGGRTRPGSSPGGNRPRHPEPTTPSTDTRERTS